MNRKPPNSKPPRSRSKSRSGARKGSLTRSDYPVGYGQPPEHARFVKGTSGNPAGRPKGSKNLKTIIRGALTDPIVMREGDRTRRVPIVQAIIMKQVENGLKGNEKSALAVMKIAHQVGLLTDAESGPDIRLTREEQRMLEEILPPNKDPPDES